MAQAIVAPLCGLSHTRDDHHTQLAAAHAAPDRHQRASVCLLADYRLVPFARVRTFSSPPHRPPPEKFRPPEEPPELILDEPAIEQTGIGQQGAPASVNERAPITTPGAFRNGPALALVAVAPVYPARAAARGLEGYVIDQFTITALGTVADVIVTDSSNALFDRYAIDAAYKFKYKPRVIDGEPVESRGVLNKFTFVLED